MCYVSHKKTPGKLVYVSGIHYNSDMFKSYWYVCTSCDASIEIVSKGIHFQDPSCNCSDPAVVWCQTSVVESDINLTKEENMLDNLETSTETPAVPESYNSNLLVTYKVIRGYSDPEYATDKVVNIEWELHNGRQSQKTASMLQGKIDVVKDIITEAYAESEDQETLRSIAEALGIELTRTVEWTATIEVSGTIEMDLLEDYDIEDEISDNLYVDSQSGRIEIVDTEICHVRES